MFNSGKFIIDLQNITDLINLNKLDGEGGALEKFEKCLLEIKDIKSYGEKKWDSTLRKKVYDFGTLFNKKDAQGFLKIIDEVHKNTSEKGLEFLGFIHSEIIWNYFDQKNEFVSKTLKKMIREYPYNPEFHHSYSNYLERNGNYDLAINEARLALKIENNNTIFFETCFNREKKYFDFLLKKNRTSKAKEIADNMSSLISNKNLGNLFVFGNILIALKDRLNDHLIINEKIDNMSKIISKETEKERKRLIEVLSIFVAILGFVFININIALSNLELKDMLFLMIAMADILIIFAITISYLFSNNSSNSFWSFLKHRKFLAVIFLLFVLLIILQSVS